ncbi:MAG: transposase [Bacteroides sp.]|nr:transposase [Bacteroides sp.]
MAILFKLKTGCQWEHLPVCHFFEGEIPSYKTVFYHYRKWCKLGDWEKMFSRLVRKYLHFVDLSLSHIDGSHTLAIRGGESVEYQGRKKRKTTNSIYFTDRQGLPLAMSEPQKGNHTDLYEIKESVDSIAFQLDRCRISLDSIFNNADAGFDSRSFLQALDKNGIIANVCPNTRNGEPLKSTSLMK